MAGNNQRENIVGSNREEIQYMLLHKLASEPISIPAAKAQFYYNTVLNTVYVYDTSWKFLPKAITPFTNQQLLVGNSVTVQAITAPINTSFVQVNNNSVASTKQYIDFIDLNPLVYTGVITEPGLDTRFPTEKAVVDYFTSGAFSQLNSDWDAVSGVTEILNKPSLDFDKYEYFSISSPEYEYVPIFSKGILNFTSASPELTVSVQPETWGALITFALGETGGTSGVTTVTKGLWDLTITGSTLSVPAYSVQGANKFDNSVSVPTDINNTLNYSGVFRASRLYEGSTRVMTSHGVQAANGTFHALSNTTHAGFLPTLPASNPTTLFLRGDGTWQPVTGIAQVHGYQLGDSQFHILANTTYAGFCPALPTTNVSTSFLRGDGLFSVITTTGVNYIPKWDGSLFVSSLLYSATAFVGIGYTADPTTGNLFGVNGITTTRGLNISGLTANTALGLDADKNVISILSDESTVVYTIQLPNGASVAARCAGAIEGVDYPTGWELEAYSLNGNDLSITHNLGRRIASVTVFKREGIGIEGEYITRQLFANAAYSGIVGTNDLNLRVEALATMASKIIIQLVFGS